MNLIPLSDSLIEKILLCNEESGVKVIKYKGDLNKIDSVFNESLHLFAISPPFNWK